MEFIIKNTNNQTKQIECDNLYIYIYDIISDINLLELNKEDYIYVLKKKIKMIITTLKPKYLLYIDIYKYTICSINIQELSEIINNVIYSYNNEFEVKVNYNEELSYNKIVKYIKKNYNNKQTHYIYIKDFCKEIILPFISNIKYIILVNNHNNMIYINHIKETILIYIQNKCKYLYIYKNKCMNDLLLLFILYEYSNDVFNVNQFEELLKYYIEYLNKYQKYIIGENNIIELQNFLLFIKTTITNNIITYKYKFENNSIIFKYIKNIQYFMYFYTFINFNTKWSYYPIQVKKQDIIYYINSYYNFLLKIKF